MDKKEFIVDKLKELNKDLKLATSELHSEAFWEPKRNEYTRLLSKVVILSSRILNLERQQKTLTSGS